MEPLVRAVLQVEKPGDKSLQIWVISPIPFCSTLCSNEASNFYRNLSKMFLGKIPSKWDTVCWNQCPISKVKNLTVKKFEGWISMKTAFLKAKADIYETGAKMSLTHHKQIHEIWPGLGKRSKIPFHFLPPTPVYWDTKKSCRHPWKFFSFFKKGIKALPH